MAKFIFVTGGVVSSLGKGIASASIAALLQQHGYRVKIKKLDPYFNIDPGTISPFQHGEVFVTDDGTEADMDLGHYERFTGISCTKTNSLTSGKVYSKLLKNERSGNYLGKTVQVIPHVTDLIKEFILDEKEDTDVIICEIGGTIGDIEGLPYFESIRQLRYDLGCDNTMFIHLTLLPYLKTSSELKTKPTQHSVKELRSIGIQPDIIICRTEVEISDAERRKIGLFCSIKDSDVIESRDMTSIYDIPINYHRQELDKRILNKLSLTFKKDLDLSIWKNIEFDNIAFKNTIKIGIIGKYSSLQDSYKSLTEAFKHTQLQKKCTIELVWIDTENLTNQNIESSLKNIDGIVIPGGFGKRGIEEKISAINYARVNNIPFLGICLGMQLAVIEYARNVLNIKNANSTEFDLNCDNIIDILGDQIEGNNLEKQSDHKEIGGSMRLGKYSCKLKDNTLIKAIYKSETIEERHRHRYEFNDNFRYAFDGKEMMISGTSLDDKYVETIEIKGHNWFIGVQFHPEYKSRPFNIHPLFSSLIDKILDIQNKHGN
jgi:CTP synthase